MRHVYSLVLVLALFAPGCGSFQPEEVRLGASAVRDVATALAAAGKPTNDIEAIRAVVQDAVGVAVEKVEVKVDEQTKEITEIKATLPPLASEIAAAAGGSLLDNVQKNRAPAGIIFSAVSAVIAGFAIWGRRAGAKRNAQIEKAAAVARALAERGAAPLGGSNG